MPFEFLPTEIKAVLEIRPKVFSDERGEFAELFKLGDFERVGVTQPLTQINYARSKKNVVRGLHYQIDPKAQAKLVWCPVGEIFDVAVDIRKDSPTYSTWVGRTLSSENKTMLYIPRGFAHGYCAMTEGAEVAYGCDEQYAPEHEGGVLWNDPEIGIKWPVDEPILVERDIAFPRLANAKNNFSYE